MLVILGGHFGVTRAALRQVVHPAVPVSDDHITGHGFSGRRGRDAGEDLAHDTLARWLVPLRPSAFAGDEGVVVSHDSCRAAVPLPLPGRNWMLVIPGHQQLLLLPRHR